MDTGSFIAYSLIDEEDVKPLEIGSWNEPCLHLNYAADMPIIFISTSGTVVLWEREQQQDYQFFNPNFVKIEENEVYIEKENEFDDIDPSSLTQPGNIEFGFSQTPIEAFHIPAEIQPLDKSSHTL